MVADTSILKKFPWKNLVPIGLALAFGYAIYVSCYVIGFQEVYRHHSKAAAIILWILIGFFGLNLFFYWIIIIANGPGKGLHIKPFDLYGTQDNENTSLVPDYFLCDENGYPFWCSTCQSLKAARSFHLSDLNYCVPKFDHYCIWIGTVIGKENDEYFFKFLEYFFAFDLTCIVYAAYYTRVHFNRGKYAVNSQYVVLYVLCGLSFAMVVSLIVVHGKYIYYNMTTLDDLSNNQLKRYGRWKERYHSQKEKGKDVSKMKKNMPRKENGKRYINMKFNGTRVVVKYYIKDKPFSVGFRKNMINLVLNRNINTGHLTKQSSFYSNSQLIKAFAVFILPYLDVLGAFQKDNNVLLEEEKGMGLMDYAYDDNVDKMSYLFLQELKKKAEDGDYKVPQYIQAQSNTATETSPISNQTHQELLDTDTEATHTLDKN